MHLLLSTGTYFFTKKPCLFLFYPFICSLSLFLCPLFPYIVCSLSSVSFPLHPLSNLFPPFPFLLFRILLFSCPPLPSSLLCFPLGPSLYTAFSSNPFRFHLFPLLLFICSSISCPSLLYPTFLYFTFLCSSSYAPLSFASQSSVLLFSSLDASLQQYACTFVFAFVPSSSSLCSSSSSSLSVCRSANLFVAISFSLSLVIFF